MATQIIINRLRCQKCDHTWIPRQSEVHICPKCKTHYWNGRNKTEGVISGRNYNSIPHRYYRRGNRLSPVCKEKRFDEEERFYELQAQDTAEAANEPEEKVANNLPDNTSVWDRI